MLICDYIGDSVQSSRPRNVQSRKEKIWELAHLLINAFESLNPLENPVFEFCNNFNDDGVNQLIIAYDIGIKRLQTIANQEIFLTESYTTIGRRARNITRVTVADITKMKKEKKIEIREEKEKEKGRGGRGRGRGRGEGEGEGGEEGGGGGKKKKQTCYLMMMMKQLILKSQTIIRSCYSNL
ncbi:unnamed protein product [Rhizophagus irregularis]|nr:unnamed protein product [Rhizophagus irregularis]CAB5208866.1 unnamed protein product [Rhizophagus irregularis]